MDTLRADYTVPAPPLSDPLPEESDTLLQRALEAVAGRDQFAVVSLPVDASTTLESLLAARPGHTHVLWHPPNGPAYAGVGSAVVLSPSGDNATSAVRESAADVWRKLLAFSVSRSAPPSPRFFGGFAFAVGGASDSSWRAFGDAKFVLPQFTLIQTSERAWLQHIVSGQSITTREDIVRTQARCRGLVNELRRGPTQPRDRSAANTITPRLLHSLAPEHWRTQVDAIRAAITSGSVRKVVAARCNVLTRAAVDPVELLERLALDHDSTFRFGFTFGEQSFVGASPECLVSKRSRSVATDALAGTSTLAPERARGLLQDAKERLEHELVVEDLLRKLTALCSELEFPPSPQLRVLRQLQHLHTPIHGRLREPEHVLDLVRHLHPTPAVAGVPSARAIEHIAAHESSPRGWYAGPSG